jgi:hypothetical protein
MKVKAVAKKKRGWNSALINDLSIVPTVEDAEEKAARIKANDDAYLWLVLLTSKRAFLHVESSQENAYVAWTNLLERYEASDTMDLLSLLQDFTKCVMDGAIDESCCWFMELDCISDKINQAGGNRKSDRKKITYVIMEAPREYVPVTDNIATMIGVRQVGEIPTITTPNNGGEAQDEETASTTNTETGPGLMYARRTKISGNADSIHRQRYRQYQTGLIHKCSEQTPRNAKMEESIIA